MTTTQRRLAAAAIVVAIVVAIFVFRGRGSPRTTVAPPPSTLIPATTPSTTTSTSGPVELTLTKLATLEAPTAMSARPNDTSLYVTERIGRVRKLTRNGNEVTLDPEPVLDITSNVRAGGESGLLGIAFSADGSTMYVAFTNRDSDQEVDQIAPDGTRSTVLVVPDFAGNHNGGGLFLGPEGYLYYTMGDGGGAGDPRKTGQDPRDLLGSILRIDPTRPSDGKPYGIPADNPFADGAGGAPEVFHYGLRNPWRMSFDRQTKDMWIGDVGQSKIEEIDFLPAGTPGGANFGWSDVEGTVPYAAGRPPDGAIPPIFEYDHSNGRCSITGGYVYRGRAIPSLNGTYLYGDNCEGKVMGLTRVSDDTVDVADLQLTVRGLSTFGEDNEGELYALSVTDGSVNRIDAVPASGSSRPSLSSDPETAAGQLIAAEATIRDSDATEQALLDAAHIQQLAYRRLGRQPELFDMIIGKATPALRKAVSLNLDMRRELAAIPGPPLKDTVPAWRIIDPPPEKDLLAYYQEAEQQFGVGWNHLAAINLIETVFGRIRGLSTSGARGPMQFMPATWDRYGEGDIDSPHDSIFAAARYLHANGFADGNVDGALWNYNHSDHYVNAIKNIAQVLADDPSAFAGYYRWEVFYVTTMGDVHLPVGYETPEPVPVADYLATHPQEQ